TNSSIEQFLPKEGSDQSSSKNQDWSAIARDNQNPNVFKPSSTTDTASNYLPKIETDANGTQPEQGHDHGHGGHGHGGHGQGSHGHSQDGDREVFQVPAANFAQNASDWGTTPAAQPTDNGTTTPAATTAAGSDWGNTTQPAAQPTDTGATTPAA